MSELTGFEIAIVGLACQFPDANNLSEFWHNVSTGRDSIRPLAEEEMTAAGVSAEVTQHPDYVNSGSFLEDIDQFDASLFGYSAKEADIMDPQHRLFLQIAWQALESSGYCNDDSRNRIGVYAGSSDSSYLTYALSHPHRLKPMVSIPDLVYENNQDLLATRVAYKLNLRGPAVTMGTACSTALVLVHHGCQALISGECDVALVGAARASVPQKSGYTYAQGGILSRDGKCRTFDKDASGTISGSGAGALVLRRLDDAIASRDHIMAVIKGTAINNDGARKVGFTAPSVAGQTEVIQSALYAGNISAESIGYLEAHGTATSLGDPIEFKALTNAYRSFTDRQNYCALGSVKANIGHLDTAAGMAGMAKVIAALQHKQIPPAVNFHEPNPEINLSDSPFYIPRKAQPWPVGVPLRAGVSAFGIGGTNAHVVVEAMAQDRASTPSRRSQLLTFSGSTRSALEANMSQFATWLEQQADGDLPDIAYSHNSGRKRLDYRASLVFESRQQLLQYLSAPHSAQITRTHCREKQASLAFLFPGQGAQYVNMGRDLYQTESVYTATLDQCAEHLLPLLDGVDIRGLLYPDIIADGAVDSHCSGMNATDLYDTRYTQPCLFAFEFALARQLEAWGIKAQAYLGHSLGEYVAACLAGVFNLNDALLLVAERARVMALQPAGAMLSVDLDEASLTPYLKPFEISLAAVNGPESCVLSGTEESIEQLESCLRELDCSPKRLRTSHGFHSHLMEGCLSEFRRTLEKITLNRPSVPFISNLTGDWCDANQVVTPEYWVEHLRSPVCFGAGVRKLLEHYSVFVEVGPGKALASLASLQFNDELALSTVRDARTPVQDLTFLQQALGKLWGRGVAIDWQQYYRDEIRFRVPTPTYVFQTRRHWIFKEEAIAEDSNNLGLPVNLEQKQEMDRWFYQPIWKQRALPDQTSVNGDDGYIICFTPRRKLLQAVFNPSLTQVVWVQPGRHYKQIGLDHYRINVDEPLDYQRLLADLNQRLGSPKRVIHALNLSKSEPTLRLAYRNSFHSLLYLAKALTSHPPQTQIQLLILSNCMQAIGKERFHHSLKSLLVGPCKVIPKEIEQVICKSVDLDRDFQFNHPDMQNLLRSELYDDSPLVAIRGGKRYVKITEPVTLADGPPRPLLASSQPTYLITGGFGGIGATLAKHFSLLHRANIVLTTRKPLPPEAEWEQWLQSHADDNITSGKIRLLQQLKLQGSRCSVVVTDFTSRARLRKALNKAENYCGQVAGIVHAAGEPDGALIQVRSAADSESVLHPKVVGTRMLYELYKQKPLRFFINCSSLSAHVGPIGQVAYCSANNYQDIFTQLPNAWQKTVSVQWDSWQEVGMAVDTLSKDYRFLGKAQDGDQFKEISHGITPLEGGKVVERVLHHSYPQLTVSTRHIDVFDRAATQEQPTEAVIKSNSDPEDGDFHERPELSVPYAAPEDEVEQIITEIWQEKFGIKPIGRNDNFFEMHGHSLLAVQIITIIKQKCQVALPTGIIYDYPTIAALAQQVRELSSCVAISQRSQQ